MALKDNEFRQYLGGKTLRMIKADRRQAVALQRRSYKKCIGLVTAAKKLPAGSADRAEKMTTARRIFEIYFPDIVPSANEWT